MFAITPLNRVRRTVWPPFHWLLTTVSDAYALTNTTEDEYAVTIKERKEDLEDRLVEMEFHRTPIAALKIRFDGNVSDGSWVHRESLMADEQLHVVIHELEERAAVDVYSHVEDNWIRHPLLHLRKKNYSAESGVSTVRDLLKAYEETEDPIAYEIVPRYRRDGQWGLYVIHLVSEQIARKVHDLLSDESV